VVRLHQESLASLAGLTGFGAPTTQNQLLAALRRHASDRAAETLEFLQRDVFNLALRNTDNHARNSAVQTLEDGRVRLTPLFDVAPMFRDPELIPRSVHWRDAAGRRLDDWRAVLDSLALADDERRALTQGLQAFGRRLEQLPALAVDHGVEPPILDACRASIEQQLEQLRRLSP
jgi:serine/threonine-protein kinase HipA